MLAEIVFWIAIAMVQMVLGSLLGCLFALLTLPIGLGVIVLHVIAIMKGINGGRLIIPGVSQYADKL
jgi:hypothetical protein